MTTNTSLQKKLSKQRAFDYCMYMMLTSYFRKSVCRSKYLEKKLYLYYQEQKQNDQIAMEEQCIRLIEKEILPKVPQKYQMCEVDTHIRRSNGCHGAELLVHTGDYILRVVTNYNRKRPEIFMTQLIKQRYDAMEGKSAF